MGSRSSWQVPPSMVAYHYGQSCKLGTGLDMADLSRVLKVGHPCCCPDLPPASGAALSAVPCPCGSHIHEHEHEHAGPMAVAMAAFREVCCV